MFRLCGRAHERDRGLFEKEIMNIYIAGPWKEREGAKALAAFLQLNGHDITHDWWEHDVPDMDPENLKDCALKDIIGVCSADVLVVIDTKVSEGKASEQGMALAMSIPIIVIHKEGDRDKPFHNVFHYLPDITHTYTILELLEALQGAERMIDYDVRDKGQREEDFVHKWDDEGHLGG